jgi:hypothetical protein
MPDMLTIFAVLCAVFGVLSFVAGILALKRRRLPAGSAGILFGLLLLSLAGLFVTVTISTQGYRALTHEEVAAKVNIEPIGRQMFTAQFCFPGGREAAYQLAGDELYVDAHILKWKPIANLFGLHTAYELDRVAGRYIRTEEEQTKPRTVFSLSLQKPMDMFHLRKQYWVLTPLLDAEYGSATFITAEKRVEVEVRVSTTGLLIRKAGGNSR